MTGPALSESSPCYDPDRLSAYIDLDAIIHNWRQFQRFAPATPAAPVLKADAYGHGILQVAKALYHAGCDLVFTASIDEAVTLTAALPGLSVAYFDGPHTHDMDMILAHNIIPVVNTVPQFEVLAHTARISERRIPAMLHLDTGMNRLGLPLDELDRLFARDDLDLVEWRVIMSHLAMAENPDDPMNASQRARFDSVYAARPAAMAAAKASLSATGGVMLGPDYHYDLTRPGIGIYGMAPMPDIAPHMAGYLRPTFRLNGRVLQIKSAPIGASVGYGQSYITARPSRLATMGGGYADGILRQLSNEGHWGHDGRTAPIIGRVSMDVHVIDITDWPEDALIEGDVISFITTGADVHDIAKKTGTIAHDVLTRLGLRAKRYYGGAIVKELDL